jgi:tetratricopeptide (TPR) repeat protein
MTTAEMERDLALRQMNAGNLAGAIEQLRRALAREPEDALAHAYLALCLSDLGRRHAARHEAELALARAPENAFVHYTAGAVARARQEYVDAEEFLAQARALDPGFAATYRAMAEVFDETDRLDQVIPTLMEGLRHAPDDPELIADLGHQLLRLGEVDLAETRAREALALDAESANANVLMGRVLLRRGDIEGAREHALLTLRADATYRPALHLMCEIKTRTNPLLGLYWRYAVWIGRFSDSRTLIVIVGSYVAYRLLNQLLIDLGQGSAASLLSLAWLGFCAYTWFGAGIFQKMLDKELASVRLRDF